jgi:hypothetical protein
MLVQNSNKNFIFTMLEGIKNHCIKEEALHILSNKEKSQSIFNVRYPILVNVSGIQPEEIPIYMKPDGKDRYYAKPFIFRDATFLVCNHWFTHNKEKLILWLQDFCQQGR